MDMSADYAKDVGLAQPGAAISYDRFHVVKMSIEAMDGVREQPAALAQLDTDERKSLMWGMRKNPIGWNATQLEAMHWLKGSNLKSARAWRLKMALREVYARARTSNDAVHAERDLRSWLN
jgi:transposase